MSRLSLLVPLVLLPGAFLAGCGDKDAPDSSDIDNDGDGVSMLEDCDDDDANNFPGNTETCDGADNDCDGVVDNGALLTFYFDNDGDSFGDDSTAYEACEGGVGEVETGGDCDDESSIVYPGAPEEDCTDPVDYNCDGSTEYADEDSDGWPACEECDDSDPLVNPDADEVCDEIDNNCDGEIDEGSAVDAPTWYADLDEDGFGDLFNSVTACDEAPSGYVADNTDCDDTSALARPDNTDEVCDGVDTNCDGTFEAVVPSDYSLIQDAIDAGETWICVAAGTYVETLDFGGQDILLESVDGAESTIIDGDGDAPVVTFASAETSAATLRGFTITGGQGTSQGAGILIDGASPTLDQLIVTDNAVKMSEGGTDLSGAGIAFSDSSATLTDSVVSENQQVGGAFGGAGIWIGGESDVLIDGVSIQDNSLTDTTAWGGGLHLTDGTLTMLNTSLTGNSISSGQQLTGSAMSTSGGTLDAENVIIAGNTASVDGAVTDYGGAVMLYGGAAVNLTNVSIANNTSDSSTCYNCGGVVVYSSVVADFVNVDISGAGTTSTSGDVYSDGITCLFADTSNTVAASYTNLFGNASGDGSSDCSDTSGLTSMLAVSPDYTDTTATDPADWDMSLGTGSALIDAGDPSILDTDGSTSDVGSHGGPNADW